MSDESIDSKSQQFQQWKVIIYGYPLNFFSVSIHIFHEILLLLNSSFSSRFGSLNVFSLVMYDFSSWKIQTNFIVFGYQIQHFYLEKKFTLKIKPKKFVDFSPAWCLSLVNISKVSYCDTNSTMKIVSSLIQKCSLQDKLDMACRNFFLLWLFLHVQGAPAIRGVP